MSPKA
jgi:hypothetical protein